MAQKEPLQCENKNDKVLEDNGMILYRVPDSSFVFNNPTTDYLLVTLLIIAQLAAGSAVQSLHLGDYRPVFKPG